jgi:hexosaminidase
VEYIPRVAEAPYWYQRIRFTNSGLLPIVGGDDDEDWEIYFSHAGGLGHQTTVEPLVVRHVNGWLYAIKLQLVLEPQAHVTLQLAVRLHNRYYSIPRWYVASRNSQLQPRVLRCTDTEELEFVLPLPAGNSWSPASRYDANSVADAKMAPKLVLPTPVALERDDTSGEVRIDKDWTVVYKSNVQPEASFLADALHMRLVEDTELSDRSFHPVLQKTIQLRISDVASQFAKQHAQKGSSVHLPESYKVTVNANSSVLICGQTSSGVFYGIQTLLSLLESSPDDSHMLPIMDILDAPRLRFRGLMLDVARNFIQKSIILKTLDVMAMYKLNKLHIHLADDQGWRLEIPGLPELTSVGSRSAHDLSEGNSLLGTLGSGPVGETKFYSTADYRDILRHAKRRHIDIIPEIDMPGHSHAAIQSMRIRYSKPGKEHEMIEGYGKYSLSDPDDTSVYLGVNEVKDCVINPCMNSTYRFVEHVIKSLIELHKDIQPLTVFHVGGDEVPHNALVQSPICRQFLDQRPELDLHSLKRYFLQRVNRLAAGLGVAIQSWEDGLARRDEPPPADLTTSWHNENGVFVNTFLNDRLSNALTFADAGFQVILSSATHLYMDNPHEPDFEERGLAWATTHVDIRKTFNFVVPTRQFERVPHVQRLVCKEYWLDNCTTLRHPENIIGLQASLWTELIRTTDQLEYMLYPRLLAVAERAWHEADWESAPSERQLEVGRTGDWIDFINTVGHKELRRLEKLGINYRLPPPGVIFNGDNQIQVNVQYPGLGVVASSDGGVTWEDYPTGSSRRESKILLATRSFDGRRRSRHVKI